jgi:hypothetical protein
LQCFLSPVCWIPSSIVFLATTPILFWPPLSLEFCGGSVNVVFFPFHGLQSGKGVSVVFFWLYLLKVSEWCARCLHECLLCLGHMLRVLKQVSQVDFFWAISAQVSLPYVCRSHARGRRYVFDLFVEFLVGYFIFLCFFFPLSISSPISLFHLFCH